MIPLAFLMIGNFRSTPFIYDGTTSTQYKDNFDQFALLVSEYPEIAKNAHFVFVPGPLDPWVGNVLPRPPIPNQYTQKVSSKIANTHFTGNPCRIKFCTQEIVVFREDLMNVMRRNALLATETSPDSPMEKQLVSTIIEQAHLMPLPIDVKPTLWGHERALHLYPQPHLLVLADRYEPYQHVHEECIAVNPGSFPNTEFQFVLYQPNIKQCDQRYI